MGIVNFAVLREIQVSYQVIGTEQSLSRQRQRLRFFVKKPVSAPLGECLRIPFPDVHVELFLEVRSIPSSKFELKHQLADALLLDT